MAARVAPCWTIGTGHAPAGSVADRFRKGDRARGITRGRYAARMSERANALAREFAAANAELIALLESATPEQWRERTEDEGELRPVSVIAHHVATAHPRIARRVEAFAHGEAVPARQPELFDERNARHWRDNPEPEQRATIEFLRQNGAAVAELLSSLTDSELERTASEDPGAPRMTTSEVIEQRQIGHVHTHLATIRTVLG
jgi:hypothetical protein